MAANDKLKKIRPLLKVRKARELAESRVLLELKGQQLDFQKQLQEQQQNYLESIEILNNYREIKNIRELTIYEDAASYYKNQWNEKFKKLREIDHQIARQVTILTIAQKKLKEIEKLESRYVGEYHKELSEKESQELEDNFMGRFGRSY